MSLVPPDQREALEAAADKFLFEFLSPILRHADKSDILTPWKERNRLSREVYSLSGVADPSVRQGTFSRRYNPRQPHLNSKEGVAGMVQRRRGLSPHSHEMLEKGSNPGRPTVGTASCTGHWPDGITGRCAHGCDDSANHRPYL